MNRINIITLGVQDIRLSKQFFKSLFDWNAEQEEDENIAFYNMGGWMFALYPRDLLFEDIGIPPEAGGFSGLTLAHNVQKKEDVAQILQKAQRLGAKIIKPAQDVFWGGHSGYFQDLDGHYWEVAYNPFTKTLENGKLDLPDV